MINAKQSYPAVISATFWLVTFGGVALYTNVWLSPHAGGINFSKDLFYLSVAPFGLLASYWFLAQLGKFLSAVFWLFFLMFIVPPIKLLNSIFIDAPVTLAKRIARIDCQLEIEFGFMLLLAIAVLGAIGVTFYTAPFGEAMNLSIVSPFSLK